MQKLDELEKVLTLRFQKKQQVFAKIVNEEGRLRSQLSKLEEQERASDSTSNHNQKAIGADVIWKAWLSRSRASINLELAQVLAQKESLLSSVRKEYGKLLVSQLLYQNHKSDVVIKRQKAAMGIFIESHIRQKRNY
ncbi:MAG: hypothetical protein ABJL72_01390 [Roseobacter sp.]